MKRDKRDAIFSLLIRERSSWCCERCGEFVVEGERQRLHCSHKVMVDKRKDGETGRIEFESPYV